MLVVTQIYNPKQGGEQIFASIRRNLLILTVDGFKEHLTRWRGRTRNVDQFKRILVSILKHPTDRNAKNCLLLYILYGQN